MKFDICDFYPSITEELLHRAVEFARQYTEISEDDVNIMMHCRKCFLFSGNDQWVKKDGNEMFNVTMDCY